MSMKNSDTIGNRSRDLPVCSSVPQPLRHRVPPCLVVPYIIYDVTTIETVINSYITTCGVKKMAQKFCLMMVNVTRQYAGEIP
jgi:hypothetical protein